MAPADVTGVLRPPDALLEAAEIEGLAQVIHRAERGGDSRTAHLRHTFVEATGGGAPGHSESTIWRLGPAELKSPRQELEFHDSSRSPAGGCHTPAVDHDLLDVVVIIELLPVEHVIRVDLP
jgi:hypothetical protein